MPNQPRSKLQTRFLICPSWISATSSTAEYSDPFPLPPPLLQLSVFTLLKVALLVYWSLSFSFSALLCKDFLDHFSFEIFSRQPLALAPLTHTQAICCRTPTFSLLTPPPLLSKLQLSPPHLQLPRSVPSLSLLCPFSKPCSNLLDLNLPVQVSPCFTSTCPSLEFSFPLSNQFWFQCLQVEHLVASQVSKYHHHSHRTRFLNVITALNCHFWWIHCPEWNTWDWILCWAGQGISKRSDCLP